MGYRMKRQNRNDKRANGLWGLLNGKLRDCVETAQRGKHHKAEAQKSITGTNHLAEASLLIWLIGRMVTTFV